jgi:Uma2 family endonuclease
VALFDVIAVMTEVGFRLKSNPDTVRAPDVAFIRHERIPANRRGFYMGAPDLAMEVLSPDETGADVHEKVREYLACGVPVVVVADPDEEIVTVSRPGAQPMPLTGDDVMDLSDVVEGFRCPLRELFEVD